MIAVTEARGTELIVNLPTLVLTYKIRIMMNMIMMMIMSMMIVVKTMVVMIVIMMMDMMIVIMMIKMIMIIVMVIVHYPLTSPLIEELI